MTPPPRTVPPTGTATFRHRADLTRFPLVVVSAPAGAPPEAIDVESLFEAFERALAMKKRHVTLHDLRGTRPDAARRQRFVAWFRSREADVRELLVAYAVLLDSSLHRHMLTAILWAASPPCPTRAFTKREDAEAWLLEMYARGGGEAGFIDDTGG